MNQSIAHTTIHDSPIPAATQAQIHAAVESLMPNKDQMGQPRKRSFKERLKDASSAAAIIFLWGVMPPLIVDHFVGQITPMVKESIYNSQLAEPDYKATFNDMMQAVDVRGRAADMQKLREKAESEGAYKEFLLFVQAEHPGLAADYMQTLVNRIERDCWGGIALAGNTCSPAFKSVVLGAQGSGAYGSTAYRAWQWPRIQKLLTATTNDPYLQEAQKHWGTYGRSERIEVLQYYQALQAQAFSDDAVRFDVSKVSAGPRGDWDGRYLPSTGDIEFNSENLDKMTFLRAIGVVAHEGEHAVQYRLMDMYGTQDGAAYLLEKGILTDVKIMMLAVKMLVQYKTPAGKSSNGHDLMLIEQDANTAKYWVSGAVDKMIKTALIKNTPR